MKTGIIIILSFILVVTASLFGQSPIHSDTDYVSNPELARQDALNYAHGGNIKKAILCYKKYAALTGKDMAAEITKLEREQYPSWFDASSMLALPMSDGSVLIVDKTLRSFHAWESYDTGSWNHTVSQEEFNAIQQAGLFIPKDGLHHSSIVNTSAGSEIITIKKGGRVVRTEKIPDESRSLTIYMMTANGKKELDCGSYTKKGQWNGKSVTSTTSDNRRKYTVFFYPTRKLRYVNGSWKIEEQQRRKPTCVGASASVDRTQRVLINKY